VIVRDGVVVGEGATQRAGGAHAEVVALQAAGAAAGGATAVVTLEPCAHTGRTGPCVEALTAAGIAEVHVLLRDPDPLAAGGLERLGAAGVRTLDVGASVPALGDAAAHDLRGFLVRVRSGRPHVTLKLAQDPGGGTTPPTGGYLTGDEARRRVHALRADVDAVLVGGGTVRADDPRLDVRHGVEGGTPRPVVLSASGRLPSDARVLRPGTLVALAPDVAPDVRAAIEDRGAETLIAPLAEPGALDVAATLALLLEHRVLTLLAEPGPRLAVALLDAGLVDVVELHVAGAGGTTPAPGRITPALPQLAVLFDDASGSTATTRSRTDDGDLIVRAEREHLVAPLSEVA